MGDKIDIGPIVKIAKTDDEWKKLLSLAAYQVLRHEDTERAFTSPLNDNHQAGVYHCAGCGLPPIRRSINSIAAPGGRASGSRWILAWSRPAPTPNSL